mgnify:CR=1 FL=1
MTDRIYVVFIDATRATLIPGGVSVETFGNIFLIAAGDTDEIYYMANQIAMQRWPASEGWGAKYFIQPVALEDLQKVRVTTRGDFP